MKPDKKIVRCLNEILKKEINEDERRLMELRSEQSAILQKTDARLKYKVWLSPSVSGKRVGTGSSIIMIKSGSLESVVNSALKKFKKSGYGPRAELIKVWIISPEGIGRLIELPKKIIQKYQRQVALSFKKPQQ